MADAGKGDRFSFLGREFLTWLWFEGERHNGYIDTPTFGPVRVEFGQRLVLESGGNLREGSTVQAEAPAETEEARTALRVGKTVARARLLLQAGERRFELGLDAESLTFTSVKLPTVLSGDDKLNLGERLQLLDEAEGLVDELYVGFVRLRKDPETWCPVSESMRAWVAGAAA